MSATTTIPVEVTPEAESYLDQLGMRPQFDEIIDHLRRTVPGVTLLEVRVQRNYDEVDDEVVLIRVERPFPPEGDRVSWDFTTWEVKRFPPAVLERIVVLPF